MAADDGSELEELREQAMTLEEEVAFLRRKLQDAPKRVRTLEERLLETKGQLAQAVSQNEKLSYTLREAREHAEVEERRAVAAPRQGEADLGAALVGGGRLRLGLRHAARRRFHAGTRESIATGR